MTSPTAAGTHWRRLLSALILSLAACSDPPAALPLEDDPEDTASQEDSNETADAGVKDTYDAGGGGGIKFDAGSTDLGAKKDTKKDVADIKLPPKDTADAKQPPNDTGASGDGGAQDGGSTSNADASSAADTAQAANCTAQEKLCKDDKVMQCNAGGTALQVTDDCVSKGGICVVEANGPTCKVGVVCDPSKADYCDSKQNAVMKCENGGKSKKLVSQCAVDHVCAQTLEGFDCFPKICEPNQWLCHGPSGSAKDLLTKCNAFGNAVLSVKFAKGTDCAAEKPAALSCVVLDGKPQCAKPVCGDGKVNGKDEECDEGKKNGGTDSTCTSKCKKLDQSCVTAKDCADKLPKLECLSHWECAAGQCIGFKSSAVLCDDNDKCTELDHCDVKDGGTGCVGVPVNCDDNNPCTNDTCDPKQGCVVENNALACDDGNKCTLGDKCFAGTCAPGQNACNCKSDKDCAAYDDGNMCNGVLVCDKGECKPKEGTVVTCAKGVCINPNVTKKELCLQAKGHFFGGQCHVPNIKNKGDCEAGKGVWIANEVCRASTCLPHLGFCIAAARPDLTACEDGNKCTIKDFCKGGSCSGSKVECDDNNLCTDDKCDPAKGCAHVPNEQPCSDGDTCTANDKCKGGTCTGEVTCECKKSEDCKPFDSKNKCLGIHKCVNNKCYIDGLTIPKCKQGTKCAPIECDPTDGACKVLDPPGEGTPCTVDGDVCVVDAACKCADSGCKSRICAGKKASCNDGNACTTDSCHPVFGCTFKNSVADCSDNNPCTKGDKCSAGSCVPGKEVCTYCEFDAKTDPDGIKACGKLIGSNDDKCTGTYKCKNFKCIYEPIFVNCGPGTCSDPKWTTFDGCTKNKAKWTDNNECTVTKCNAKTGACEQTYLAGVFCSDNNECTVNDHCEKGDCATDVRKCDDGDPCTLDACIKDKIGGCDFNKEKAEGKACDDGNKCTVGSTCKLGFCLGGKKKVCNDGNTCTFDTCSDKTGDCDFVSLGSVFCTTGDKCVSDAFCDAKTVTCKVSKKLNCNKGSKCLDYSCDPKVGCVQMPNEVTCTSPDKCFKNGKCQNGSCQVFGTEKTDCDDGNVCTNDSCNATEGCRHKAAIDAVCTDNDACTLADTCIQDFDKQGNELGLCAGKPVNCNDENACTSDSCDAKLGCQYKPTKGVCGVFANCSSGPSPKCVFAAGSHIVISEISLGGHGPEDDFVELHNASTLTTNLANYEVQWRPPGAKGIGGWNTLLTLSKDLTLGPGQYVVVGHSGPLVFQRALDAKSADFKLQPAGMQVRLYDVGHTLEHDRVAWGLDKCNKPASGGEGTPLPVWPGVGSWERKASKDATADTMRRYAKHWLAGNAHDTGDNDKDFIHRPVSDPQPQSAQKVYEPACMQQQGIYSCSGQKPLCDYKASALPKDWGKDQCVADNACSLGCGQGQTCEKSIGVCVSLGSKGILISEVYPGSPTNPGQFIELHNAGSKDIDIGGFLIQTKKKETAPGTGWDKTVAVVPGRTIIPPGRYFVVANKEWVTKIQGGVDLIVNGDLGLSSSGAAVQIYDPATNIVIDLMGYGPSTKTYSIQPFALPNVPAGQSLVRKASAQSHPGTMGTTGAERLKGNGRDTDNDSIDWTLRNVPEPWSLQGGKFKPACNGACQPGTHCNFAAKDSKCLPQCGTCKAGQSCNFKTGKCNLNVLISGYSNYGPSFQTAGTTVSSQYNWFVELYNPGDTVINMSGMLLQFRALAGSWRSLTKPFPDGTCVLLKTGDKVKCAGKSPCECKGELGKSCKTDGDCAPSVLLPKQYMLVAPYHYDPAMKPDLRSHYGEKMEPDVGQIRIVHIDAGKVFGPNNNRLEADVASWGTVGLKYEKDMTPQLQKVKTCDGTKDVVIGEKCMMRRLPSAWATVGAAELNDAMHAAFHAGNGRQTSIYKDDDWVRVCPRAPRSSKLVPKYP